MFGISVEKLNLEFFLGLAPGMSDAELRATATVNYAVFRATQWYRHNPTPAQSSRVYDALEHWCKTAL